MLGFIGDQFFAWRTQDAPSAPASAPTLAKKRPIGKPLLSSLPLDLIKTIISSLPFYDFLAARRLSKKFRDITYIDWLIYSKRINFCVFRKYCLHSGSTPKSFEDEIKKRAGQFKVLECFDRNSSTIDELNSIFDHTFNSAIELHVDFPQEKRTKVGIKKKFTDEQLTSLIKKIRFSCPNLRTIVGREFPNSGIRDLLSEYEKLEYLKLMSIREIDEETGTRLNSHATLQKISISMSTLNVAKGLTKLRKLNSTFFDSSQLQRLTTFSSLTSLTLSSLSFNDDEFIASVSQLKSLQVLRIGSCVGLTPEIFKVFPQLKELRKLRLVSILSHFEASSIFGMEYGSKIVIKGTKQQMAYLLQCPKLTEMHIHDNLTEDHLKMISQIENLRKVHFGYTLDAKVVRGLTAFKFCSKLESLCFHFDSAQGLGEIFSEITQCRTLRNVDLTRFRYNLLFEAEINKILEEYPHLNIYLPKQYTSFTPSSSFSM